MPGYQIDYKLTANVASGSKFTIPYPSGYDNLSFTGKAYVDYNFDGQLPVSSAQVGLGKSGFSVTNKTGSTWKSGTIVRVILDLIPESITAAELSALRDVVGVRAPADANKVLSAYGVRAYDTCATNITIGTTTLTHTLENERPRFQSYTRKCVLSSAASEIRFASASFTADQTQKALSIDVYIESPVTEFSASNPYITVNLSNTTSLGSNYSRWVFDAGYLRQGWNTLKMRYADTVSATSGAGNLPTGCNHPTDVGTGFDWTGTGQFFSLTFTNMNGFTVHVDELRRPAMANPILVIGFDASGSGATDETFVNKVAPLFSAYGIRSYCTMTNVYELINSGGAAWKRMEALHNTHGWDVLNHTWNHGATEIGRTVTLTSLSRTSNLATAVVSGGHSLTTNKVAKLSIQGATPSDFNGTYDCTVTTSTGFTYSSAGVNTTCTGTIKLYTYLSEVLGVSSTENQRILEHELTDIARVLRGSGFSRGSKVAVFPNNSVPELSMLQTVCSNAGIKFARGYRGGYTFVNELGIDNPLNIGSFVMDSGTNYTRLSEIQAKVQGAIDRGEHIWIFGHFILDDEDPANAAYVPTSPDYPPSQNGNPAPPAGVSLSGFGGWWYMSQLRTLIEQTIGPAIRAGTLTAMSPSEYAAYMDGRT